MNDAGTGISQVLRTSNGFNIHVQEVGQQASRGRGAILLVNGAFASTRATRAVWCMLTGYDLILYDLPHVGSSKAHNDPKRPLAFADEIDILAEVVERCRPAYLGAMSWGGAAALLALAERQLPIEKAIICSFSDRLTRPMRALLERLRERLAAARWEDAAALLTDTLGEHLHSALKRANFAYLSRFLEAEHHHILRHIERLLPIDGPMLDGALGRVAIDTLFINGALDVYTPGSDAQRLAAQVAGSRVAVMANMGHFLGIEGKEKRAEVAQVIETFLEGDYPETAGARRAAIAAPLRAGTG